MVLINQEDSKSYNRNLKSILQQLDLTAAELADIINQAGGRAADKPIIISVSCETCQDPFYISSQVKKVRDQFKASQLCPNCKAEQVREMTRERVRKFRKKADGDHEG